MSPPCEPLALHCRYLGSSRSTVAVCAPAPRQFVHDKGDNRTHEEAFGYVLKDMPEEEQPDGTFLPTAEQDRFYREPKTFWYLSNMSIDRCRICILAYQVKNQQQGGQNFAKSGFTYCGTLRGKDRHVIEPKNIFTWPVSHGRRHGFLAKEPSFLKLLCLMFESGEYELGLALLGFNSVRSRARIEALHRLNLNPGLAATIDLMELVVCGCAGGDGTHNVPELFILALTSIGSILAHTACPRMRRAAL